MRKVMAIAAASLLPLALIWVAGNVAPVRRVFIPDVPRVGGGK